MSDEVLPEEVQSIAVNPWSVDARIVRRVLASFSVVFVLTLPWLAGYSSYLITLRRPGHTAYWANLTSPFVLSGVLVALLVALLWLVCLSVERKMKRSRYHRIPLAFVATLMALIAFGFLFQSGRAQWFFLEAVKVRAAEYSYPRSIAFWKRDAMDERIGDGKEVILMGSSQVNLGMDPKLMAEHLDGARVSKYALPGFGIMQYLMTAPFLIRMKPTAVVCWLSEFDTFRENHIPSNRLREFSTARQTRLLASTLSPIQWWENRAQLLDIFMGSVTPVWKDRDLIRALTFNYWWRAEAAAGPTAETGPHGDALHAERVRAHIRQLEMNVHRTGLLDANFKSYRLFASMLVRHGIKLYVFEGEANPEAMSAYDPGGRMRRETRERFEAMATRVGFTYVPSSQMPHFTIKDFADAVHLNSDAEKRFSLYLASYLKEGGL